VQAPPIRELVVSAAINGVKIADTIEVLDVNGLGVLLSSADFDRLRLTNVTPRIVTRGASEYVSLSRTPGLKVVLNVSTLELSITADAALFSGSRFSLARPNEIEPTRETGIFSNYDLSLLQTRRDSSYSGYVELVGFSPWGSLISTGIVTYVSNVTNTVRLETAFQREFPSARTRLRVGDSATVVGQFGSSVRFGGVQYGTEDATDPRFVWRPLLAFSGTATVPSTIDVFVNNGFQRRLNVPPGSFSVDDIATITGRGTARLVVRDATGREVVIEQPFFTVPGQLRQGVSRYSFAAGWLRDAYALESNRYSSPMAAAYWRYGFAPSVTTELRVETKKGGPTLAGASVLVPFADGHSLSVFGAGSRSPARTGFSTGANYSWSGTRSSIGVQAEYTSRDYQTLASVPGSLSPKRRLAGTGSLNLGAAGSLSAAYVQTEAHASDRVSRQANLNYFYPINKEWKLSTGFSHTIDEPRYWSAYLGLAWYGGNGLSAAVTGNAACDSTCERNGTTFQPQAYVASRSNNAQGFNWQVDATRQRARASGEYLTPHGILSGEVFGGSSVDSGGRFGARGSLAWIDGSVFAGQPISDSFIVVRAPEAPGAPVVASGSRSVNLDSRGTALLPRVVGYEQVIVRMNQEDLPLDVSAVTTTASLAVPSRAGAVARIRAKRTSPATFTLLDRQGIAIAVGTTLKLGTEQVRVGLDGLVYIENYAVGLKGVVQSANRRCEFVLPEATTKELMPYLGNIACDLRSP
jgi:outer membrane usher protein